MTRFDHRRDYLGGKFLSERGRRMAAFAKFRPANNASARELHPTGIPIETPRRLA
jgi:hypothetical protein